MSNDKKTVVEFSYEGQEWHCALGFVPRVGDTLDTWATTCNQDHALECHTCRRTQQVELRVTAVRLRDDQVPLVTVMSEIEARRLESEHRPAWMKSLTIVPNDLPARKVSILPEPQRKRGAK